MTLTEELETLEAQKKEIEAKIKDCYRRSLEASEDQKVCLDNLADMIVDSPERETKPLGWHVDRVGWAPNSKYFQKSRFYETGVWVSVRPCAKEFENKTYLGMLIGEAALSVMASYDEEGRVLHIRPSHHNPCIWVPDVNRVILGCESWWGEIKSPEDLRKITDTDIENVWYVRALRDLGK